MKTLRSLLLPAALAAVAALPLGALAQQNQPYGGNQPGAPAYQGQHHGGGMMREMQKLNLSSQQQTQIRQIMQQFRASHPRGSRPDRQTMQQLHSQVMGVLTPQQQAQFKADMQKMRSQWRSQHPGGDGDQGGQQSTPQP